MPLNSSGQTSSSNRTEAPRQPASWQFKISGLLGAMFFVAVFAAFFRSISKGIGTAPFAVQVLLFSVGLFLLIAFAVFLIGLVRRSVPMLIVSTTLLLGPIAWMTMAFLWYVSRSSKTASKRLS